jgi:5'-nucleotidase/UDP-sugar diphosphatase
VRHIVLMTHHGFDADQALVSRLRGVDVVIGGDSHTLLGDFKALGLPSGGRYPTVARNADGDTVCIGQAWEYGKAFGLMNVAFDAEGRVSRCDGQAALVIGEPFKRKDAAGAWQPMARGRGRSAESPSGGPPGGAGARARSSRGADAGRLLPARSRREKARPIGTASEPLCLVRVPGERADPRAGAGLRGGQQPGARQRRGAGGGRGLSARLAGAPTSRCRTPAACGCRCRPAR